MIFITFLTSNIEELAANQPYYLMKKNLSIEDRLVRFVIFDGLLGATLAGFDLPPGLHQFFYWVSIYIMVTIIFGYSPLYHLLGISTRQKAETSNTPTH